MVTVRVTSVVTVAATTVSTGAWALVSTGGRRAARIGATTSRALRRSTGSRRARTRMVCENFSTDRLRTTSSWCFMALGIR